MSVSDIINCTTPYLENTLTGDYNITQVHICKDQCTSTIIKTIIYNSLESFYHISMKLQALKKKQISRF